MKISVNGQDYSIAGDKPLLSVLRDEIGMLSVKEGCDDATCGTCVVIAGGKLVKSCSRNASTFENQEIITAEGPMPCHRVYRLYARAAGLSRVGKDIQSALNKAVAYGLRQQEFQQVDEWNRAGQIDKVVRIRGTPPVRLRERGLRDFDEVPPMELAVLIQSLLDRGDHTLDEPLAPEPIFRTVLAAYGSQRLTLKVRQSLERANVLREAVPAPF